MSDKFQKAENDIKMAEAVSRDETLNKEDQEEEKAAAEQEVKKDQPYNN